MTYNALADGVFTFAQFLIPALAIAWADRRRKPAPISAAADGER
jgi:hypothetical protein